MLFHIQIGPSVEITPQGDPRGGATLICSSYVGSGPASTVHPTLGPTVRVIICFSTTFEVSADLTVLESYNGVGIYLSSLS